MENILQAASKTARYKWETL